MSGTLRRLAQRLLGRAPQAKEPRAEIARREADCRREMFDHAKANVPGMFARYAAPVATTVATPAPVTIGVSWSNYDAAADLPVTETI